MMNATNQKYCVQQILDTKLQGIESPEEIGEQIYVMIRPIPEYEIRMVHEHALNLKFFGELLVETWNRTMWDDWIQEFTQTYTDGLHILQQRLGSSILIRIEKTFCYYWCEFTDRLKV